MYMYVYVYTYIYIHTHKCLSHGSPLEHVMQKAVTDTSELYAASSESWTSKMPKNMAQYLKTEYRQYSSKIMDPVLPILSYGGILGHCSEHLGGPGSVLPSQQPLMPRRVHAHGPIRLVEGRCAILGSRCRGLCSGFDCSLPGPLEPWHVSKNSGIEKCCWKHTMLLESEDSYGHFSLHNARRIHPHTSYSLRVQVPKE